MTHDTTKGLMMTAEFRTAEEVMRRGNGNVDMPWTERGAAAPPPPSIVPVAWLGRTSTEDTQDPTLSLPRQLRNSRAALPDGWVIVAHFYDVESGRKDLAERGRGVAHERFDIPIPRDGGIQDLLAEAERPDRRFAVVMCESIERVARRTYFGTKIEYELDRNGVTLCAADEPIAIGPAKKATPTLTRRVKQAVAEWYVLQMLELSWDGFCEHTRQGWNTGKPPYGYLPEKVPHPVAARRAEGRTKHRLVPDPVCGPVVTRIFELRAVHRLGYDTIASRLNADLEVNPAPQSTRPGMTVGRWTGSAVREVLNNPKYTGYMVWNRRATKKGGKCNPRSEWVWSPHPVHEPLVTRELFEAVAPVGKIRQGSRSGSARNLHPATKRTYLLRSYLVCEMCGRRMHGKSRKGWHVYYACNPDRRQHSDRPWFAEHPKSIWVREDLIAGLVHDFFARRIFGPHRRTLLEVDLSERRHRTPPDGRAERVAALRREIDGLERRQQRLIEELELAADEQADAAPEMMRELRAGIHKRFAELGGQARAKRADLERLAAAARSEPEPDVDLIDALPRAGVALASAPDEIQRAVFDAYGLEIHYHHQRREVTLRATVTQRTLGAVHAATRAAVGAGHAGHPGAAAGRAGHDNGAGREPDAEDPLRDPVSHLLCAPGRIRTCAPASGAEGCFTHMLRSATFSVGDCHARARLGQMIYVRRGGRHSAHVSAEPPTSAL